MIEAFIAFYLAFAAVVMRAERKAAFYTGRQLCDQRQATRCPV